MCVRARERERERENVTSHIMPLLVPVKFQNGHICVTIGNISLPAPIYGVESSMWTAPIIINKDLIYTEAEEMNKKR